MRARFKIIEEGKKAIANVERDDDEDADRNFDKLLAQKFVTPTILLLNRQITAEALEVILKKPFVVELPIPQRTLKSETPGISSFIPRAALDATTLVTLRISMNADGGNERLYLNNWVFSLLELVNIWVESDNLKSVHVQASGNRTSLSDETLVYMLCKGVSLSPFRLPPDVSNRSTGLADRGKLNLQLKILKFLIASDKGAPSFMRKVTFGEGLRGSNKLIEGDKISPNMYLEVVSRPHYPSPLAKKFTNPIGA